MPIRNTANYGIKLADIGYRYLFDGEYPAVHHVWGGHDVRSRPGEGQRLLGYLGKAGGIVDWSISERKRKNSDVYSFKNAIIKGFFIILHTTFFMNHTQVRSPDKKTVLTGTLPFSRLDQHLCCESGLDGISGSGLGFKTAPPPQKKRKINLFEARKVRSGELESSPDWSLAILHRGLRRKSKHFLYPNPDPDSMDPQHWRQFNGIMWKYFNLGKMRQLRWLNNSNQY